MKQVIVTTRNHVFTISEKPMVKVTKPSVNYITNGIPLVNTRQW